MIMLNKQFLKKKKKTKISPSEVLEKVNDQECNPSYFVTDCQEKGLLHYRGF